MGFGPWEIMIGILILLLLFGASRIPKLARGLGEGVNEFKKGLKEGQESEESRKEQAEIPSEGEDETPPSETG